MIIAAIVFPSCDFTNDNPSDTNLIRIRDNSFDPPVLSVAVGRIVAWRHEGNNPHTVTSGTPTQDPGSLFDSGNLNNGNGFTFTFNQAGTYQYFCRIHGTMMSGTIQVQ